ncbi:hypothetical protein Plim_1830 [Planctopirus limnophila DSM 3776]|uniref:Uncharacterized protein n=2 Tax=Planctopirus limnophila TaxID=120 RepID=D5SYD2_PLAL2|nr:hypothetical protein Plim_1830 [Planctopirus limnophila DSM 3776]
MSCEIGHPNMTLRTLTTFVLSLAVSTIANAQTWTSPDGLLTINPPDAGQFQFIPEPPPPLIGLWVSHDESMKFGVVKIDIPPKIKLIQSSVEEGLAKEIDGKVTRLPTRSVLGHEVWKMVGKGTSVEITQAVIRHDGALYKLMAATVGKNPDPATVNRFVDSLSIVPPSPTNAETAPQPDTLPVGNLGGGVDLHKVSTTVGGAGALLAIGLVIYFLTRGNKTRQ